MTPLRFSLHRYSRWDGSQREPLEPADALGAMADDLLEYGDLRWALRNLMSRGMDSMNGPGLKGLKDLLRQLREQKMSQLKRYSLDGMLDEFRERLAAIEAREAGVAVDLTLQHWELSRDRMERFVRPDPLPLNVVDMKEARNAL